KTTTLAKMAAHEKLKLMRNTALMTLDDFKIGGAEQLASYARILEVPFVRSRADISLEEQVKLQKADTIFIDTFGVSPIDTDRMARLKRQLDFQDPALRDRLEVHLALSAGISAADVPAYTKAFEELHPGYLLFTKWDE